MILYTLFKTSRTWKPYHFQRHIPVFAKQGSVSGDKVSTGVKTNPVIGSISNHHHDDDNENGKTAWLVLEEKQQLCTRITLFSTFLWGPVHDYVVYGGREHITTTNFLLSFVRLNKVLQNSTPRKVAYIWQIERVQKDAIKFKRQQIKFSSDVFIAVFVKKKNMCVGNGTILLPSL